MGALSDGLNPPRVFKIAGHELAFRRANFADVYLSVGEALRSMGEDRAGLDLEGAVSACILGGDVPKVAMPSLLQLGAVVKFDDDDLVAVMQLDHINDAMDAVTWIIGFEPLTAEQKAEAKAEREAAEEEAEKNGETEDAGKKKT